VSSLTAEQLLVSSLTAEPLGLQQPREPRSVFFPIARPARRTLTPASRCSFSSLANLAQWKESPQAQELVALGLSIVKPCFSIVSTKSMTAPCR
jgi:hypothetical protein